MKVLVWNAPWIAQGNLFFYKNCFIKHLLLQANLLSSEGCSVDIVVNDFLDLSSVDVNNKINIINLSREDIYNMTGILSDPSRELYEKPECKVSVNIKNILRSKLKDNYDVILLWETPVPFLEFLFPDALIIHQMPGTFCRAPYPHMVTFDPVGLYKRGSFYNHFDSIVNVEPGKNKLVTLFQDNIRNSINQVTPFSFSELNPHSKFDDLALLPLQTSGHYAFLADTPYISQAEFLLDILNKTPASTGLVVTQYVTPHTKDTVLTDDVLFALRKEWPNLIFNQSFDKINSISQYLLPFVDKVISCSSSIAMQSIAWNKDIIIPYDTFIHPLDISNIEKQPLVKRDIYENILDFIISKQQPLASKIIDDGKFLVCLLEEMISRKKANKSGVDLFVDFASINDNYYEDVFSQFNVGRATRDIIKSTPELSLKNADALKLDRIIKREEVEHITFDVFDTLINRPVEVPSDVYKFLESKALIISNGLTDDFFKVRTVAEVEVRNNSENGEITLDEIYDYIQEHYQLDAGLTNAIKKEEIELEISLVQQRPAGKKLWDIAQSSGKPISIISDMYLPESVIEQMLNKCGYDKYEKLYVSSSYGVRKKEGGLFDIVLDEINLPPKKIIHIGDNVLADIKMPQERGMLSFRVVRALDRMRKNKIYADILNPRKGVGEKPRSIIAGLIAANLFDDDSGKLGEETLFLERPYNLGYAALGPIFSAFSQWLSRQAKLDKVERLYFLSREGWILKEIYDILTKNDPNAPASAYLYCSRRAVRVASIRTLNDILNISSQPFSGGVSLGKLLHYRFGLRQDDINIDSLLAAGFGSLDEQLNADISSKVKFSKLCLCLKNEILDCAEKEREVYLEYLQSAGMVENRKFGIVDIGWKANMQHSLGELLGKSFNGYYYATLQGAERWLDEGHIIKSFVGNFLTAENKSCVVSNRHFMEFLTCHTDRSLVSMSKNSSGEIIKNYRTEPAHTMRVKLIDEIHSGIKKYAIDMIQRYGSLASTAYCDWALAEKVLSAFFNNPTKRDAAFFVGQAFEDSFGGVEKQFVIGNSTNQLSVFKNGARVTYHNAAAKGKKAETDKVAKNEVSLIENKTVSSSHAMEAFLFKRFVSVKKYNKYINDRDAFFIDSKSKVLKRWYSMTTKNNK